MTNHYAEIGLGTPRTLPRAQVQHRGKLSRCLHSPAKMNCSRPANQLYSTTMHAALIHSWLTVLRNEKMSEALRNLFPRTVAFIHVCGQALLLPLLARHEIPQSFIHRPLHADRIERIKKTEQRTILKWEKVQ